MNNNQYYIGIDGGSSSVGWAVTTPDYQLVKKGGREMWGVRLFEEAQTAAKRRSARTARRRLARRNYRLKLLRELFAEEISKVDPAFYLRMDESFFWYEDKNVEGKYTLFNEDNWNDRDFFNRYPTIYHLRKALMQGKEPFDVRLVYLAVHHIIKHRGHFLFEGQSFASCMDFDDVWYRFKECFEDLTGGLIETRDIDLLKKTVSGQYRVKEKQKMLKSVIASGYPGFNCFIQLLAGAKTDLSKAFGLTVDEDTKKSLSLSFSGTDMDDEEKLETYSSVLGDLFSVILYLKAVYDWGILTNILGVNGQDTQETVNISLSDAKVDLWEKHKSDLKKLKKVIREVAPEKYKEAFRLRKKGLNNYVAYSGHSDRKKLDAKRCTQEEFYKYIRSLIGRSDNKYVQEILTEMEASSFLPLQHAKENSVIPYQIHLLELNRILDNASEYLPFLKEKDCDGISVREKIESLLTFRVPYYVGPLDNTHAKEGTHWAVKIKDTPAKPWNFGQVVDLEASAEKFINKMTNCCSYLIGEPVLPKNSIVYSRFMVLNEINNITIYGEKIPVEIKQRLFSELFLKEKQVRRKDLNKWFVQNGLITKAEEKWIGGIDEEIKASLKTEIRLREIFGNHLPATRILEEIIRSVLILGQEPAMLRKRIKRFIPDINSTQLKKICNLQISGWGRLSKKFLCEMKPVGDESEQVGFSIMDMLWMTNNNLRQLMSNQYEYAELVASYNKEICEDNKDSASLMENLPVPPFVRRTIWQTTKITQEIVSIMGKEPEKIFIEMARGPEEKKRTISRKQQLYQSYLMSENEMREYWCDEINSLDDMAFRRDALYLYFTQMGTCMYTGEKIDLDDILDKKRFDDLYDIDHIWPQCRIKDDSLENRVLVKKSANQTKGDIYPVAAEIRNRQRGFWETLYKMNLIGKKKFDRLTRTIPFSDQELGEFIERQLVETRYSTKIAADLLQRLFPQSRIIYVKAGNVSDFRQQFGFIKVRDLNDLHHAKDAYLNIVVGNVFNMKFTSDPWRYIKKNVQEAGEQYSLRTEAIYKHEIRRGNNCAWNPGKNGSIAMVQRMLGKNHPMVTWQEIRRNSGQNGGLHDQNPVSEGTIPLKGGDIRLRNIERYGGYSGDTGAYLCLVEHGSGVLVLENPGLFTRTIWDLSKQCNGEDGEVVISDGLKTLQLKKDVTLIRDLYSVDLNEKKILNPLINEIKQNSYEDNYLESHASRH